MYGATQLVLEKKLKTGLKWLFGYLRKNTEKIKITSRTNKLLILLLNVRDKRVTVRHSEYARPAAIREAYLAFSLDV